jgi:hypothetical protein
MSEILNLVGLISSVFGNPITFVLIGMLVICAFLFFIRASKEVIIAILTILITATAGSGFIPVWVVGVVIVIVGLFLAPLLIRMFFRGGY